MECPRSQPVYKWGSLFDDCQFLCWIKFISMHENAPLTVTGCLISPVYHMRSISHTWDRLWFIPDDHIFQLPKLFIFKGSLMDQILMVLLSINQARGALSNSPL